MAEDIFEDEFFQITRMSGGKRRGIVYQFNLESSYVILPKAVLIKSLKDALKALSNE